MIYGNVKSRNVTCVNHNQLHVLKALPVIKPGTANYVSSSFFPSSFLLPSRVLTFVLGQQAALGARDVIRHAVRDAVPARLEVAQPRWRPLPPRPVRALAVLCARPPARGSGTGRVPL